MVLVSRVKAAAAPRRSAVQVAHHRRLIAIAGRGRARRRHRVERRQVVRRQLDVQRGEVLLQVRDPLRAGDRDDVLALRERPGDGQLCRRAALGPGERLDLLDQRDVVREVLALVARRLQAPVVRRSGRRPCGWRRRAGRGRAGCSRRSRCRGGGTPAGSRARARGRTASTRSAAPRWGGPPRLARASPATPRRARGSRTLPSWTSLDSSPTVSSIGVERSMRCW